MLADKTNCSICDTCNPCLILFTQHCYTEHDHHTAKSSKHWNYCIHLDIKSSGGKLHLH